MADPFSTNISSTDATRYDSTQYPGGAKLSLATRVRQLRIETDALVAGVTNASVIAALSTSQAGKITDPTDLAECITVCEAIIDVLESYGLAAS